MNKEAYEKLIDGVILPEFPFILDFKVRREIHKGKVGFMVEYSVNLDYAKGDQDTLYHKLNDETRNMFKLIGFPPHINYMPIRIDSIYS